MPRRRTVQLAAILAAGTTLGVASAAPAATIDGVDGTAVFTAAPGEKNVVTAGTLAAPGPAGWLNVVDASAPLTASGDCQLVDAHSARCPETAAQPRALVVWAGDRSDTVTVDDQLEGSRTVTLHGQRGADILHAGGSTGGTFKLYGESGDDTLSTAPNVQSPAPLVDGGTGDDTLHLDEAAGGSAFGGDGDDTIRYAGPPPRPSATVALDGGNGDDTYTFVPDIVSTGMRPSPGIDTLDQSGNPFPLVFNTADCLGCVEIVVGTASDDTITGDATAQVILGGAGADHLEGGGGPDVISGQAGGDTIVAADGAIDAVRCGAGTDTVSADPFDLVSRTCEIRS